MEIDEALKKLIELEKEVNLLPINDGSRAILITIHLAKGFIDLEKRITKLEDNILS